MAEGGGGTGREGEGGGREVREGALIWKEGPYDLIINFLKFRIIY